MRAAVALLLLAGLAAPAAADSGGCGVCHGKERVLLHGSIHEDSDIGCVACHGGDSSNAASKEAAHAESQGFRGRIGRRDVPEACGTCHADVTVMRPFDLRTDALAAYRTSHHGRAVLEKGDETAAVCTDCHGAHDVFRTSDPRSPAARGNVPATCARCHADEELMAAHDLDTSAVTEFAASVHGRGLAHDVPGVPSCADCHDAHAAAPPGAQQVADVCGHCHAETRERFRESPHFAASKRGALEQCITCHGNHAVSKPDFDRFDQSGGDDTKGARCLDCHDAANESDVGAAVAREFGAAFRAAEEGLRSARVLVDGMERAGFYSDDERDALARAERELVRSVPLSHTVDRDRVGAALRRVNSLVDQALAGRESELRVSRDRRIYGSVAGILLLGIAWFMALWRRRVRRE